MSRLDCTMCGVCCISPIDQPSFCDVEEKDEKRLGKELTRRYVWYPSMFSSLVMAIDGHSHPQGSIKTEWKEEKRGPFKGYKFCRCVFLQGVIMKKVKCRVYAQRPTACHAAMKPGDRACKQLRQCFQETIDEGCPEL